MTAKYNKRPEGLHLRRNKPVNKYSSIMEFLLLGNDFQTSTLLLDADIAKRAKFDSALRKHGTGILLCACRSAAPALLSRSAADHLRRLRFYCAHLLRRQA